MVSNNQQRILKEKISIETNQVKNLFDSRAIKSDNDLHAVMLQNDDSPIPILRDQEEQKLVQEKIIFTIQDLILDLGCGAGRITRYLNQEIQEYHGIDFSQELIKIAKKNYQNQKNYFFYCKDICAQNEILRLFDKRFNKIFCIAVLLYLNDDAVKKVFETINLLADKECEFYLRESICELDDRLTLKNCFSEKIEANYNAIYRTEKELLAFTQKYIPDFKIIESNYFCHSARQFQETNQKYYLFRKT